MLFTIVIAILLLGFLIGYRVGVIRIGLSLFLGIVSLILVSVLTTPVTNFIVDNTEIDDKLSTRLVEALIEQGENQLDDTTTEVSLVQQINIIQSSYLPEFLQESLISDNNNEIYAQMGVNSFFEYIGAYIARWIIKAVVFVITFIVVFIAMQIFVTVINLLAKLPIIHGTNKIMGGLLGIMISLVVIWMIFITIDVMYQHQWARDSIKEIQDSQILSIIYQNNLVLSALGI